MTDTLPLLGGPLSGGVVALLPGYRGPGEMPGVLYVTDRTPTPAAYRLDRRRPEYRAFVPGPLAERGVMLSPDSPHLHV